jgi:hypothetical protein
MMSSATRLLLMTAAVAALVTGCRRATSAPPADSLPPAAVSTLPASGSSTEAPAGAGASPEAAAGADPSLADLQGRVAGMRGQLEAMGDSPDPAAMRDKRDQMLLLITEMQSMMGGAARVTTSCPQCRR